MSTWREGKEQGRAEERRAKRTRRGKAAPFILSGTAGCFQATVRWSRPGYCQVAVRVQLRQNTNTEISNHQEALKEILDIQNHQKNAKQNDFFSRHVQFFRQKVVLCARDSWISET